jgi:hypothetical protein
MVKKNKIYKKDWNDKMKKILFLLLTSLIISGCSNNKTEVVKEAPEKITDTNVLRTPEASNAQTKEVINDANNLKNQSTTTDQRKKENNIVPKEEEKEPVVTPAPKTETKPTTVPQKQPEATKKKDYTPEEAIDLVWDYLKKNNYPITENDRVDLDHTDKDTYSIHFYEGYDDHIATINWFDVNIHTGEVKPMF